jgi:hypothetical protein
MDTPSAQAFRQMISKPFRFRFFLLRNLPMAYLARVRILTLTAEEAVVTLPLTYLTKNPFGSIYFACLAMAAELASGVLSMMHVYKAEPGMSMLVLRVEASFVKKAVGVIRFTCRDGSSIAAAIDQAKATGEGATVMATSLGTDNAGDQVAEFRITWAFKMRRSRE